MERVNQYFKDRTESYDDYYPCIRNECNLLHVHNQIQFFVSLYNYTIANNNYDFELEGGEYYLELTEPILFYYLNITTDWKYLVN